jgi:hypothetical protein
MELYWCPICKVQVGAEHFACRSGELGGKAGTGKSKARSSAQATAAALIRWHRKRTGSTPPSTNPSHPPSPSSEFTSGYLRDSEPPIRGMSG